MTQTGAEPSPEGRRRRPRVVRRHLSSGPVRGARWVGRPVIPAQAEVSATAELEAASSVPPTVSLADACSLLGCTPHVLRRLLDDFGDHLPPLLEIAGERRLPTSATGTLDAVLRWRNEGAAAADIQNRLVALRREGDTRHVRDQDEVLIAMAELRAELRQSINRQAEDRDRLVTMLMRTNQQLNQMRFELASRPRRERRKSWWQRLFHH